MSEYSTEDVLKVIKEIVLPPAPPLPQSSSADRSLGDDLPESLSYVVRGSVISFDKGTPSQQTKDTLYWSLFAQLAADVKHNRLSAFEEWYTSYMQILGQTGWQIGKLTTYTDELKGVVEHYTLDRLKNEITNDQFEVVDAGLKNLDRGGLTGDATTILGRATGDSHAGFNEIGVAGADPHNNVELFTQTISFASPDTYVTYALFVNIPKAVDVKRNNRKSTLIKQTADKSRDTIYQRVQGFVADNIRALVDVKVDL